MEIEKVMLPDHYGREGRTPLVIVNHVTVGSKRSVINTFKNPANKKSSTFLACRDGSIVQFCRINQRPKTNGNIRSPKSPIVRQMGNVNPNLYSVTIENEDAIGDDTPGVEGELTEKQFWANCWLHKYIQTEVERIYGFRIPLNSHHVIGHKDIDSIGKALCPGPLFPWARLYAELAIAETADTLEHYEERIDYHLADTGKYAAAYAIVERIRDLAGKLKGGPWAAAAEQKLMLLAPLMPAINYTDTEVTAAGIALRVLELGDTAMGTSGWQDEAVRKLMLLEPIMKEKGLL